MENIFELACIAWMIIAMVVGHLPSVIGSGFILIWITLHNIDDVYQMIEDIFNEGDEGI